MVKPFLTENDLKAWSIAGHVLKLLPTWGVKFDPNKCSPSNSWSWRIGKTRGLYFFPWYKEWGFLSCLVVEEDISLWSKALSVVGKWDLSLQEECTLSDPISNAFCVEIFSLLKSISINQRWKWEKYRFTLNNSKEQKVTYHESNSTRMFYCCC